MIFEELESQRGKPLIIFDGNIFNFMELTASGKKYRCQNRACNAVLVVSSEESILLRPVHKNHSDPAAKIQKLKANEKFKKMAKESNQVARDIIIDVTKNLDDVELSKISKFKVSRDMIQRIRRKYRQYFDPLVEDIPNAYKLDLQGNRFLLYDSGIYDKTRIIIFSSKYKQKLLKYGTIFAIDGTFKIAPSDFNQILTIHFLVLGSFHPIFYILIKSQSAIDYTRAFNIIKENTGCQPKIILTDFEKALISSTKAVFTGSKNQGCFFHFSQAIWRRIQNMNCVSVYKNNVVFRKLVHMFLYLAFVPIEKVQEYYELIKCSYSKHVDLPSLNDFYQYFEHTYVGVYHGNIRMSGTYELAFWNCYERTIKGIPRTTNSLEAWHRAMNASLAMAHPNIAKLIETFQKEEEIDRIALVQALNGDLTIPRTNFQKEAMLKVILESFELFEGLEYFEILAK